MISPGIILVAAFALIGAQATRVLAPRNTPYIINLILAVIGVIVAELVVYALDRGGPQLGVLHPVVDLIGIAVAEISGMILWPARAPRVDSPTL